jgi:hypothetical protein
MAVFQLKWFVIKRDRLKEDKIKLSTMMIFSMYGLLCDASNSLFYSIDDSEVI